MVSSDLAPLLSCTAQSLSLLAAKEEATVCIATWEPEREAGEDDEVVQLVSPLASRIQELLLRLPPQDTAHLGKWLVLATVLDVYPSLRELAFLDADLIVTEDALASDRSLFARQRETGADLAMYDQGEPKEVIREAILSLLPDLDLDTRPPSDLFGSYLNTGVVTGTAGGMRRMLSDATALAASLAPHGPTALAHLPFFDQGFVNAILWSPNCTLTVARLSFRWNTSHSKYYYHHGNRFWLTEAPALHDAYGGDEEGSDSFSPFLLHFMGCAGRTVDQGEGARCKVDRMAPYCDDLAAKHPPPPWMTVGN